MLEYELFLGFPVDPLYRKQLDKQDPERAALFIRPESGDYLEEVSVDNLCYLGKRVGEKETLSKLDFLEENIMSLLKKLVPDFLYEEAVLYLFPVEKNAPRGK